MHAVLLSPLKFEAVRSHADCERRVQLRGSEEAVKHNDRENRQMRAQRDAGLPFPGQVAVPENELVGDLEGLPGLVRVEGRPEQACVGDAEREAKQKSPAERRAALRARLLRLPRVPRSLRLCCWHRRWALPLHRSPKRAE